MKFSATILLSILSLAYSKLPSRSDSTFIQHQKESVANQLGKADIQKRSLAGNLAEFTDDFIRGSANAVEGTRNTRRIRWQQRGRGGPASRNNLDEAWAEQSWDGRFDHALTGPRTMNMPTSLLTRPFSNNPHHRVPQMPRQPVPGDVMARILQLPNYNPAPAAR